jgi:copper transport protein
MRAASPLPRRADVATVLFAACRLLLPIALAIGIAALPRLAMAHAVLLETSPAAGSDVAVAPTEIVLLFNEPMRVIGVTVMAADGTDMTPSVSANAVDGRLVLPLPQLLPDGRYLVNWRIGSLDGHVLSGSFAFAVGEGMSADDLPASVSDGDEAQRWFMVAVRGLSRLALLFAAGIALFRVLLSPPAALDSILDGRIRRLAVGAFIALLLLIGTEGAQRTALGIAGFASPDAWRAAFAEPTIVLHLISLAGLAVLALRPRGIVALIGALASFATLATSGHVLTHLPMPVGQALMIGHGLVAAMWLGAISPLRSSLTTPDQEAVVALFRRFHVMAAIVVSVVLASGIVMAWLLLPRFADLWSSAYGLRLCAKLAAVATMLAIAAVNRFWLTERALAGVANAKVRLGQLFRLDIVAAALAVVLAAGLSFGPPPLASLGTLIAADHYEIALELSPGRAGDNDIEIVLIPLHGGPMEPLSVKLRAGSPASGDPGLARPLSHQQRAALGSGKLADRTRYPGRRFHPRARIDGDRTAALRTIRRRRPARVPRIRQGRAARWRGNVRGRATPPQSARRSEAACRAACWPVRAAARD